VKTQRISLVDARVLARQAAQDLDRRFGEPDFSAPLAPTPAILNGDQSMTVHARANLTVKACDDQEGCFV